MKTAILLCGGDSKRMGVACEDMPKCCLNVGNASIIEKQISHLSKYFYEKIIIACQEKHKDLIAEVLENITLRTELNLGDNIIFSVETEKLGTAGALRQAMFLVDEKKVLVINCDDLTDINLDKMEKLAEKSNVIAITRPKGNFGVVKFDQDNNLLGFEEKGLMNYYVSIGWYILDSDIVLVTNGDLEKETFPYLKDVKVFQHDEMWFPINDLKQLSNATKYFTGE